MSEAKKINQGSISELFDLGENRVIKLYYDYVSQNLIDNEYRNNLLICNEISTAKALETKMMNGRRGIIFEKLDGLTLLEMMKENPWLVVYYAKRFAETHFGIHKCTCTDLPSQKEYLRKFIYQKKYITHKENQLISELEQLPAGNKVCHNDFVPTNILFCQGHYYTIDWSGATNGDPAMDVAHTLLLLKKWVRGPEPALAKIFKKIYMSIFLKMYLHYYLQLSGFTMEQIMKWEGFLDKVGIPLA